MQFLVSRHRCVLTKDAFVHTARHAVNVSYFATHSTPCLVCQEYYLLALAQPRRDSKALGGDMAGAKPARSVSSALKPSFFKNAASIAKSDLSDAQLEHGNTSGKPQRLSVPLSADSSGIQSKSSHDPVSDSPSDTSANSGGPAAELPQGTLMKAECLSVDTGQERQAVSVGDLQHHSEQVRLLTNPDKLIHCHGQHFQASAALLT